MDTQNTHARARHHIPTLTLSKVAHLESSAEADAKVLLQARNKIDEVQRRLKAEKGEHVTTTGLLEEERARSLCIPHPQSTNAEPLPIASALH